MIFDEVSGELLITPTAPTGLVVPAVGGENDDLVRRTRNGLRPADLELDQPPQDPEWQP